MLNNLATVCSKLSKHSDVKKHCDEVLKLDEKNVKALVRRGMNAVASQEFDDGEADFKAAQKIDPESGTVKKALNDMKRRRKRQKVEDKKLAKKMMAPAKKVEAGLTKAERKAAEAYDAKQKTTSAQRTGPVRAL